MRWRCWLGDQQQAPASRTWVRDCRRLLRRMGRARCLLARRVVQQVIQPAAPPRSAVAPARASARTAY